MKEPSISPAQISVYGAVPTHPARRLTGLGLTLLAHGLLLWLIVFYRSDVDVTNVQGSQNTISWILPNQEPAAQPQPAAPAPPQKAAPPKAAPAKKVPRKVITREDAPPIIRPEIVAVEPAPQPSRPEPAKSEPIQAPAEDMSAMLEAARKRRSEAARPSAETAEESEAQRADRIAKANIARSGSQKGRDEVDAGGLFEVRNIGVSSGEIFFRGWRSSVGRTASQLINVYATPGQDIQVAIVHRIIEVIRAEKPDEFIWNTRRLGRQLTLSARRDQQEKLTVFLLSEFFPDYEPSRGR